MRQASVKKFRPVFISYATTLNPLQSISCEFSTAMRVGCGLGVAELLHLALTFRI